jgi:hypothetical protein
MKWRIRMKTILVDMTDKDFYRKSGVITPIIKECCNRVSFADNEDYDPSNIEVIFKISTYDTSIIRYLRNWFTLWRFRYEMNLMCKVGIIVSISFYSDYVMDKVCYNDYVKGGSR